MIHTWYSVRKTVPSDISLTESKLFSVDFVINHISGRPASYFKGFYFCIFNGKNAIKANGFATVPQVATEKNQCTAILPSGRKPLSGTGLVLACGATEKKQLNFHFYEESREGRKWWWW